MTGGLACLFRAVGVVSGSCSQLFCLSIRRIGQILNLYSLVDTSPACCGSKLVTSTGASHFRISFSLVPCRSIHTWRVRGVDTPSQNRQSARLAQALFSVYTPRRLFLTRLHGPHTVTRISGVGLPRHLQVT
jgi:hypothetical protein